MNVVQSIPQRLSALPAAAALAAQSTALALVLAACIGEGEVNVSQSSGSGSGSSDYTIGGSLVGLEGNGLVLQNNGGDDLSLNADGSFSFSSSAAEGDSFEVSVATQPDGPEQQCTVSEGSGTVSTFDVDQVLVTCGGQVEALYTADGSNWMDYVENDGTNRFSASDSPCSASGEGYYSCIHGGEYRRFAVPGQSSCSGLSATDSENAFWWHCNDNADPLEMISGGLKPQRLLSDLIDFSGPEWRSMSVEVQRNGVAIAESLSSPWWNNPFVTDSNGGTFSTSGTIVVATSPANGYYSLTGQSVALVAEPGTIIDPSATAGTVVTITGASYAWFEGTVDASNNNIGVSVVGSSDHVVLRGVSVCCPDMGSGHAIDWTGGDNGLLRHIRLARTLMRGIRINGSSNGTLVDAVFSNTNTGIDTATSAGGWTVLNHIGASDDGLPHYFNAADNIIINSTLGNVDSTYTARFIGDGSGSLSDNNLIMNLLTVNTGYGLSFTNSADNSSIMNYAGLHNTNAVGINSTSAGHHFTGVLKAGNNAGSNCDLSAAGSTPGLIPTSCNDGGAAGSSSYTGETSDAVFWPGVDGTNTFVGKVSSDGTNPDGAGGSVLESSLTDWHRFDNAFRTWGAEGTAFPDGTNKGVCDTGSCRIWDWSLSAGDSGDPNNGEVALNTNSLPDGDDTFTHSWFSGGSSTFLRNAYEIIGDGLGNEDGLCESNEACIYTPNIGAYQGHGSLVSTGSFTDGTISGVTLYEYENNGR